MPLIKDFGKTSSSCVPNRHYQTENDRIDSSPVEMWDRLADSCQQVACKQRLKNEVL